MDGFTKKSPNERTWRRTHWEHVGWFKLGAPAQEVFEIKDGWIVCTCGDRIPVMPKEEKLP